MSVSRYVYGLPINVCGTLPESLEVHFCSLERFVQRLKLIIVKIWDVDAVGILDFIQGASHLISSACILFHDFSCCCSAIPLKCVNVLLRKVRTNVTDGLVVVCLGEALGQMDLFTSPFFSV